MGSVTLIGGSIVIGLALCGDAKGTIGFVVAVITVRGITWLFMKICESIKKDYAEMLNFAGWSVVTIPAVGILKNAIQGFSGVSNQVMYTYNQFTSIGVQFQKFADWIEKLTFWSK